MELEDLEQSYTMVIKNQDGEELEEFELDMKEFSTGSFGYGFYGKFYDVENFQISMSMVVIGSKE